MEALGSKNDDTRDHVSLAGSSQKNADHREGFSKCLAKVAHLKHLAYHSAFSTGRATQTMWTRQANWNLKRRLEGASAFDDLKNSIKGRVGANLHIIEIENAEDKELSDDNVSAANSSIE